MEITREDILPFIDIPTGMEARVDAWLGAISAILTNRYSAKPVPDPDPVPPAIAPAVFEIVANAIALRLPNPNMPFRDPRVKAQAVAGGSVQYFDSAQFTGWFDPSGVAGLNDLFGVGSVRSVRTPAPDAVRYGNVYRTDEWLEESDAPIETVI